MWPDLENVFQPHIPAVYGSCMMSFCIRALHVWPVNEAGAKMRRTVKILVQKKVLIVLAFQHDIHSLCRAWLDKSGTTVSTMFFFFKTAIAGLKDKTTEWRPKATFYKYSQILNMPNPYPFKSHLLHRTLQGKYSGRFYYRFSVLCPLISGRFRSLTWKQRLMLTMTFLNKITLSHSWLYFHINTGSKR